MKIVCETCHAKYSLADEKIAGRAVTVRCKKCGEKIAVEAPLTGARQESSVLFSLDNLRSLAGAPSTPREAATTPRAAARSTTTGEGSGLIDIRALVDATRAPGPAAKSDTVDLLAGIASPGSFAPLAPLTPVLTPVRRESRAGVVAGAAIGSISVLAAAAVVVAFLFAHGSGAHAAPRPEVARLPAVVAPPAGPTESLVPPTPAAPIHDVALAPTPEHAPIAIADDASRVRRARRVERAATHEDPALVRAVAVTPPGAPPNRVEAAVDAAFGHAPPTHVANEDADALPQTPTRDQVMTALRALEPGVRACGQGTHGLATTQVTVSGATGSVTIANVSGSFAGSPIGSCVARAARNGHFPRFRQATFQVTYPFAL